MRNRYVVPLLVCVGAAGWFGPSVLRDIENAISPAPMYPAASGMGTYRIVACKDISSPGSKFSSLVIDFKNTTTAVEKVIPGIEIDENPIGTGLWDEVNGHQLTETSGASFTAQPGQTIVMAVVTVRTTPGICEQNLSVDFFVPRS